MSVLNGLRVSAGAVYANDLVKVHTTSVCAYNPVSK